MKKKKIQLKNLEVKSFVTNTGIDNENTVKANGGGFLSLFGNTCRGTCGNTCGGCTLTCGVDQSACTCTGCPTNFQCPTDPPCNTQGNIDTECVCM